MQDLKNGCVSLEEEPILRMEGRLGVLDGWQRFTNKDITAKLAIKSFGGIWFYFSLGIQRNKITIPPRIEFFIILYKELTTRSNFVQFEFVLNSNAIATTDDNGIISTN